MMILFSYLFDLVLGDPENFPHPVRMMGKLISFLEKKLRKEKTDRDDRKKGFYLVVLVIGTTFFSLYFLLYFAKMLSPLLYWIVAVYFGYVTLSMRDLWDKAKGVVNALVKENLEEAREKLSMMVGRDTAKLNKEEIIKATVESIAENTNDGIIAPLFYLILGGPILAFTYKAINTLDSMVGYKNEKYLHFGWASAKIDDCANFVPARISGFLISVSSLIKGKRFTAAFKTMVREGRKHPSPNSGFSEAAMAQALGIELGGPVSYQGEVFFKPYIGKEKQKPKISFINDSLKISLISSILFLFIGVIIKWII